MQCKNLILFIFGIIILSSLGSAAVYVNTTEDMGHDLNAGGALIYPATGMKILANVDGSIVSIIKDSDTNATVAYVMNASKYVLGTATFVGNQANFSIPVDITQETIYYLMVNKTSGTYTQRYKTGITLPINTGVINWTHGVNEVPTESTTEIIMITGAIIQVG